MRDDRQPGSAAADRSRSLAPRILPPWLAHSASIRGLDHSNASTQSAFSPACVLVLQQRPKIAPTRSRENLAQRKTAADLLVIGQALWRTLLRFAEYSDTMWGRLQPAAGLSPPTAGCWPSCGAEVPRRPKPAPHWLALNSANL